MWTNKLQGLQHTAGANNLLVIHTPHERSGSLIHLCDTKHDKQTRSRSASSLPEHFKLNQKCWTNWLLLIVPSSQSSVMFLFSHVLTGTCHLEDPFSCSPVIGSQFSMETLMNTTERKTREHQVMILPFSVATFLLSSHVSVWWVSLCLGTRWRALNGHVFSSLASLGWFWVSERNVKLLSNLAIAIIDDQKDKKDNKTTLYSAWLHELGVLVCRWSQCVQITSGNSSNKQKISASAPDQTFDRWYSYEIWNNLLPSCTS